jgi:hypothetical protein
MNILADRLRSIIKELDGNPTNGERFRELTGIDLSNAVYTALLLGAELAIQHSKEATHAQGS